MITIKPGCDNINNTALLAGYQANINNPLVRRSHQIEGRFENVYLTEQEIPALTPLIACAIDYAKSLLSQPIHRTGFWFNAMPPGSCTSKHDHNDGDELLSGVFYVSVPRNSGDLLLYQQDKIVHHTPAEGQFVFFLPDVKHAVETNLSQQMRLSVAFNFLAEPEID